MSQFSSVETSNGFMSEPSYTDNRSSGFTFVELLVVLLIVSLAIAMLAPKVVVGSRQMQERGFVVAVQTVLERARFRSMSSGQAITVWIDSKSRRIISGSSVLDIPKNVDIYGQGLTEGDEGYFFNLFPDGSSSASRLEIVFDESRKFYINFNPITGSIHWYEVNG
ncbi:MAG: prepilin-type N-terminal cleavage/methylation domain-containing protein [Thermodesulforhabdaceae bacterium]